LGITDLLTVEPAQVDVGIEIQQSAIGRKFTKDTKKQVQNLLISKKNSNFALAKTGFPLF
jgi:hypothetical protein